VNAPASGGILWKEILVVMGSILGKTDGQLQAKLKILQPSAQ
jgi:hypothetical protein